MNSSLRDSSETIFLMKASTIPGPESLQGTCSVLVLHSLPSINSKCVLSHLFWELETLRSGSCLLLCLLGHWGQCYLCSEMHGVYLLGVCVSSVICLCSVAQSYLTLCDPMDCSPPCSSVHGIFQVRILEWVAISYPRGPSWIRDRTHIFCVSWTGRQILYPCATWEAQVFV